MAVEGRAFGSGTHGLQVNANGTLTRERLAPTPEHGTPARGERSNCGPTPGAACEPGQAATDTRLATALWTLTIFGLGLVLILTGIVSYGAWLTRETRSLARANSVRIEADHQALMAIQRQIQERTYDEQR